jgi:hypothetical protein
MIPIRIFEIRSYHFNGNGSDYHRTVKTEFEATDAIKSLGGYYFFQPVEAVQIGGGIFKVVQMPVLQEVKFE